MNKRNSFQKTIDRGSLKNYMAFLIYHIMVLFVG